mmetsp:Transcript_22278/g.31184  ORF Transcript_22278/g.31184 Transcript_22278/m.31184 type:complete len:109 (+) Transcript_22278:152-478(+)
MVGSYVCIRIRLPEDTKSYETMKSHYCYNTSCVICCNPIVWDLNRKVLCCGHAYHPVCILRWLREHESCPICRKVVVNVSEEESWLSFTYNTVVDLYSFIFCPQALFG